MLYSKTNKLFLLSLLSGPVIWLIVYALLPVSSDNPVSLETILFILCNYFCLIAGFVLFDFKNRSNKVSKISDSLLFKGIVIIVLLSYFLRYIDLFVFRELSFDNHVLVNRELSDREFKWSYIVFYVASVFKSLYFFPFVLIVSNLSKRKKEELIIACLLLLLPLLEALLKGTRKPFFDIFIIVFLSIIVFNPVTFTIKKIVVLICTIITLLVVSNFMLFNRESKSGDNIYEEIISARYNDLLKPNTKVEEYILDENTNNLPKQLTLIFLHTGQYLTHGFFEFNYIVQQKTKSISYGTYSLGPLFLITHKKLINPSPREFVYITAFGGLYLDFRWLALIVTFIFGVFQKFVFQKAIHSSFWRPLLIYLIIINVFLPMFHYIRGAGVYPFLATLALLAILQTPLLKSK